MKKYILSLGLIFALGYIAPSTAQTNHVAQEQELVDSTQKDELEAFSDTASTADSSMTSVVNIESDDSEDVNVNVNLKQLLKDINEDELAEMVFALLVIMIIFLFSPLAIFGLLLFFIFRNRRQKMKLAQMAIQNGQPIPDQLLNEQSPSDAETYKTGMRQLFLGIGLMVFLGLTIGKVGFGIGILVLFIGLGKVVIARKSMNQQNVNQNFNQNNNNQDSNNIESYE